MSKTRLALSNSTSKKSSHLSGKPVENLENAKSSPESFDTVKTKPQIATSSSK
jgi:hypothetical protein